MLAVVVASSLVFDPRRGHDGSRPKYVVLVLGAAVAGALLLLDARAGRRTWRGNRLAWPVVALVSWAGLATVASNHPRTAMFGFPGLHHGLLTHAALAVLFFATVAGFRPRHVRPALEVLWLGAGTAVVAFGLAQLADRLFSPNRGWDWARPAISPWTIGSTVGNPNHLSSFLAILLPLGVVLGATATRRSRRAILAVGVVAVAELAITASRAGTLGAAAGLAVLGVLFRRRFRRHRRVVLGLAAAAAVLVVTVTVALGPSGATKVRPADLARIGPGTTLDLRLELWASAWRMAADHPIVGVGPDVFPIVFPQYATQRFGELYGPFTIANGAHDIFLNTLANLGAGGLAALLVLFGAAAAGVARTWRRLPTDGADTQGSEVGEERLLIGGTAAALVAYVVQAGFNTDEVALSVCFWVILGLVVVLSTRLSDESGG